MKLNINLTTLAEAPKTIHVQFTTPACIIVCFTAQIPDLCSYFKVSNKYQASFEI